MRALDLLLNSLPFDVFSSDRQTDNQAGGDSRREKTAQTGSKHALLAAVRAISYACCSRATRESSPITSNT